MSDTESFGENYSFEWPIFPKNETENELRISEVAMREGADGFPDPESKILSMTENEIVGRIRRFYTSTLQKISNEFLRLGDETANIKIFLERFDIGQMPGQLKAKVETEIVDSSVTMQSLGSELKIAKDDLKGFKRENNITREPVYSHQWRYLWGPFILFFLFFSEVLLNGALVSSVVDGLIAGISVATTVAVINVFLSFIVGKNLLPQLHTNKNQVTKWGSLVGIVVHVFVILYVNLVFGIFRSISIAAKNIRSWEEAEGTTQIVVNALRPWETFSQINDIPSLFVIGVGIVFALIALLDGYHYDDHFPGYGEVHRKYAVALVPFENAKKNLSDRVLAIVENSCSQMDRKIEQYEAKMTRWATIQNIARQQLARYVSWMDQMERDTNKLLNDYRAANIRGRHSNYSTKSPPAYFENKWTFAEEEKNPSKKFSHLAFLLDDDRGSFENKILQIQQEMASTRNESVLSIGKFMQGLQESVDKESVDKD